MTEGQLKGALTLAALVGKLLNGLIRSKT
jgi:hypothetical protein